MLGFLLVCLFFTWPGWGQFQKLPFGLSHCNSFQTSGQGTCGSSVNCVCVRSNYTFRDQGTGWLHGSADPLWPTRGPGFYLCSGSPSAPALTADHEDASDPYYQCHLGLCIQQSWKCLAIPFPQHTVTQANGHRSLCRRTGASVTMYACHGVAGSFFLGTQPLLH